MRKFFHKKNFCMRKKCSASLLGLLLSGFLSMQLTGCGAGRLEESYSFSERQTEFTVSEQAKAPLFAEKLCVLEPENQEEDDLIQAEAGALFDLTDASVLYSRHATERLHPASITKVMTALLALEEGSLEDLVTVTEAAVVTETGASLCGITPGDQISLRDLLYGLMIPSGNDAANAIAVHLSGSIEEFAEKMTERARQLGAVHTQFKNPSGLTDEEHYTTAYDLYLIFNEALKQPLFREIIGTHSYTANYQDRNGQADSQTWTVGNWYLKGDVQAPEGVTVLGGKTGTTKAAGYCLIQAECDVSGHEYISVVLKSDSRKALYENMTNIITKIVN